MSQDKSPKIAPVDERLPVSKSWVFSLQHVLAMCAGAVAVPMMIGNAARLDHASIVFNKCLLVYGRYRNTHTKCWYRKYCRC